MARQYEVRRQFYGCDGRGELVRDKLTAREARALKARMNRRASCGVDYMHYPMDDGREARAAKFGLLPESRTFVAYEAGEIDEAEARRIGAITAHRHEETNYDDLLACGLDRDTARTLAQAVA